ncbi:tetratricopeptide repeat protein [Streptomyces lavendulae]|nr:tetratricopeptide repeat protein [Streptomyces lavendulae]TXJ80019.1 tetratricopeptide repeat protein [Streptomyces lavendulae]
MDNRVSEPGTPLPSGPPAPRRSRRLLRRVLVTALSGGVVAGAVLAMWPGIGPGTTSPPAPGPRAHRAQLRAPAQAALALTAVTTGMPATLPALTALIGQQEQRVRAQPQDAKAWAVLGTAYVERGRATAGSADFPRAEKALETSLQAVDEEQNVQALDGLTALSLARRDYTEAKRYAEQAQELAPARWSSYSQLIDADTGLGDYDAVGDSFDKLMALKPGAAERPAVMARAAAVYRNRGWREDAVAQLTDAAAAARTPAEQAAYLTQLGQLAFERGDLQDALRHYDAALRQDAAQPAAPAGRARVLAALGRTKEAVTAYRAALARRPDPRDALDLGELYESLGMTTQARESYGQVRELARRETSNGVDDELVLGRYEADHGDAQQAVERLRAEYDRQPGTEVADALGWALHRAGEDEEALEYATTATDGTKGGGLRSALYAYHRGAIESALELDGPARRSLREALQISPAFSPLWAREARSALAALGDPPDVPVPG